MYPMGCENISASIPSVLLSPASESLSLMSGKTSFLFGAKRLKNETRFLSRVLLSACYILSSTAVSHRYSNQYANANSGVRALPLVFYARTCAIVANSSRF